MARDIARRWWTALRAEGVGLDVGQLEGAMCVADALDAAGRADRLFPSIQGILTKNDRDLALLHRVAAPDLARHDMAGGTSTKVKLPARRSWRLAAGIVAGVLTLAALVWLVTSRTPPQATVVRQVVVRMSPTEPQPPAQATLGMGIALTPAWLTASIPEPPPAWAGFAKATLMIAPLAFVAALLLWLRARAPDWTRLSVETAEDRLSNNLPAPSEDNLFAGSALRSLAAALKGQSDEPSERIDIRRTVEATAAHAGLLQVVWEPRPIESPVHFAIERRSREDHISELYFRAADRLRTLGTEVSVSQYRYNLSSRRDEEGRPLGAQRLDPWESKALLIAVGEGDGLFEAAAIDPNAALLRPVESWPRRILLSIRPVMLWSDREERLGAAAMAVAPASARGFNALADRLFARQPLRGLIGVRSCDS